MVLLFDFGGVLVNLDKQRCIRAFKQLGLDVAPYLGAYRQSGPFSLLEQGRIKVQDFCDSLRQLSHQPELTNDSIIAAWKSFLTDVPEERLEMLLKLKRHYSVNLLSNTNAIHWSQARDGFFRYKGLEVEDFFDHIFLSYEMGIEKPAPALYAQVVRELSVPADEVLFFDDSEVNCEAARQCGLQSLLAPADSAWFKYFDNNGKLHLL